MKKTLLHEEVERLPRDLWTVPYISMFRQDELERFGEMFPGDLTPDLQGYITVIPVITAENRTVKAVI